jgi:hypothetical protein
MRGPPQERKVADAVQFGVRRDHKLYKNTVFGVQSILVPKMQVRLRSFG